MHNKNHKVQPSEQQLRLQAAGGSDGRRQEPNNGRGGYDGHDRGGRRR